MFYASCNIMTKLLCTHESHEDVYLYFDRNMTGISVTHSNTMTSKYQYYKNTRKK